MITKKNKYWASPELTYKTFKGLYNEYDIPVHYRYHCVISDYQVWFIETRGKYEVFSMGIQLHRNAPHKFKWQNDVWYYYTGKDFEKAESEFMNCVKLLLCHFGVFVHRDDKFLEEVSK